MDVQAYLVHDDPSETQRLRAVLSRHGFSVIVSDDQSEAAQRIRRSTVDLLVLKQVIGGRHTTSVALAGELKNPRLATLLLSERARGEALELFELIPSLKAVLGVSPGGSFLGTLAVEAVTAATTPVLLLLPEDRIRDGAMRPCRPSHVSPQDTAA